MKVADVMTTKVELAPPDATVQAAATAMAEHDIGALLVGTPEKIDGILTDRDILLRVVVEGRDPKTVTVGEVMSATLFTCRPEEGIEDAFHAMSEHQVRRLPVIDEDGALRGIVVLSDLAAARTKDPETVEALRTIAEPHRHPRALAEEGDADKGGSAADPADAEPR